MASISEGVPDLGGDPGFGKHGIDEGSFVMKGQAMVFFLRMAVYPNKRIPVPKRASVEGSGVAEGVELEVPGIWPDSSPIRRDPDPTPRFLSRFRFIDWLVKVDRPEEVRMGPPPFPNVITIPSGAYCKGDV